MATIKDIAKETGLGLATISKYLNNKNILPENKILIEKAIDKLNYKLNPMGRALKTNKSNMIGIVIPELANLFTTTIISDIEDALKHKGYGVIVADCRSDETIEREKIEFMLTRQVDGIIHVPVSSASKNLKIVAKNNIPTVVIDRKIDGMNCDFVGVDNVGAGEKAVNLLVEKGHKKIAIIAGPGSISTAKERLDGYINCLKKHGIKLNKDYIMHADYTIESGYKAMKELILNNRDITAVFVSNYETSVGAMIAINELGVKIPKNLSIVGFDSIELSKVMSPKLTIISQPMNEIAKKAAELILSRLEKNGPTTSIILDSFVEHGKSIKKL